uniref:Uncharacterized protein n=1 Tax=Entomoneis paludosa TaxID=265537 RepID=A0A7S3DMJ8_9STRA
MTFPQHLQDIMDNTELVVVTDNCKTHECVRSRGSHAPMRRHSDLLPRMPRSSALMEDDKQQQYPGDMPMRRASEPLQSRWEASCCKSDSAPLMKTRGDGAMSLSQVIRSSGSSGLKKSDLLTRSYSEPTESFSEMLANLDLDDM